MALRERTHRAVRPRRSQDPYNPKKLKGKSYRGSNEQYLGQGKQGIYDPEFEIKKLKETINKEKKELRKMVNAQRLRHRRHETSVDDDAVTENILKLQQEIKDLQKDERLPKKKKKRKRGRKQESLKRLRNPQKVVVDPFNEALE